MDRIAKPKDDERAAYFSFTPERESGNIVIQTKDLAVGYQPDTILSEGINLDIRKGDTIALIGPNGIGKSTLLKTLVDQIPPMRGDVSYGTKIDIGYYEQEQENLTPNKSVLNEVWDDHPLLNEETIRTFLGSFLFTGEDVEKSISSLSGGERARVSIAKLALNHDNFLVLDEPTNHLDIDSKEVLENALIDFEGTLLFVSHDRYFINRLANKIIEVEPDGATLYLGDYDYFLHKKEERYEQQLAKETKMAEQNTSTLTAEKAPVSNGNWADRKEAKREIRRIEREIADAEKNITRYEEELEELTEQMDELSSSAAFSAEDSIQLNELSKRFNEVNEALEAVMLKWEMAHDELSEFED